MVQHLKIFKLEKRISSLFTSNDSILRQDGIVIVKIAKVVLSTSYFVHKELFY